MKRWKGPPREGDMVEWQGIAVGGKESCSRRGIITGGPSMYPGTGSAWPVMFDNGEITYVFEHHLRKL